MRFISIPILACLLPFSATHYAFAKSDDDLAPSVYQIQPTDDLQYRLQNILIQAVPGDVIEFSEGKFALRRQIDIATDNITLRGQGSDKTIISFKGQNSGGQGIESTGNNFVIEGLAVEDTAGNAIKVLGARNVTFRDVRAEWTGPAQASNGAYGLYPVQCQNVLIDSCFAIGASDAGIYVGQSRQVVVRNSHAERNVAGIEIENTVDADVYDNVATDNAGGLLVFDLPGLQQKSGRNVRVFRNNVYKNNHRNFAAPGNIVASVPSGTGVMVMATDFVEVYDNNIADNQTSNVLIVGYAIAGKIPNDKTYDAYPEAISIHNNRIKRGGSKPTGTIGKLLAPVIGGTFPDILFDGSQDPKKLVDGKLPNELGISVMNNGSAKFANFNYADLTTTNILTGKFKVDRDLAAFSKPLAPVAEVTLAEHDPPSGSGDAAVTVYRSVPKTLSEYGLFKGNGSTQEPVEGVVPYTLNTTLFSDYTTKYRFIRMPDGFAAECTADGPLEFPEGTVIAKTFSYPHDMTNAESGEQLLETRIETKLADRWYGFSYAWNEEQTEATLALGGHELEVSWVHEDGTERTNRYEIPNANQCLTCHSENKTYQPIGPTAMNMNCDFDYAHGSQNQLEFLESQGRLKGLTKDQPAMPVAFDPETGSLDERARAWLHVNCAHCHRPTGTARTSGLDLSFTQTDDAKYGFWKSPVAAGHGSGGRDYDVVPGKPDKSILLFRIESEDPSIRMPNVARNLVPTEAAQLIREWIASMPKDKGK